MRAPNRLKVGAVLVLTAGFLGAVLGDLDVGRAWAALRSARWVMLLPMCALYLVAHVLRAVRLGLLLGQRLPFRRLFAVTTVGFLAINVIPLRLGEMVRPWLLAERDGVPWGRSIAAIVVERVLDMTMLLGMLLGLTWVVDLPPGRIQVQGIDVVVAGQRLAGSIVLAGVIAGALVVVAGEPAIRRLERLLLVGRSGGRFARRFREGLVALVRRPRYAAGLVAISAAIWALTIAAVDMVMAAFEGMPTGLGPAWSTWAITLSGMTVLPTPGFFGTYELFCTVALWLWGVNADLARTFAVVLHLGQFGFIVSLGSIFLVIEGLSLRDASAVTHDLFRAPSEAD